jgi:hypothetical protein
MLAQKLPQIQNMTLKKEKLPALDFKKEKILFKGRLASGYDYGFLQYAYSAKTPDQAPYVNGDVSVLYKFIPLNISYNYIYNKNIPKTYNYFRIAYDADFLKQQLRKKVQDKLKSSRKSVDSLSNTLKTKQKLLSDKQNQLALINGDIAQSGIPSIPHTNSPLNIDTTIVNTNIQSASEFGINKNDAVKQNIKDSLAPILLTDKNQKIIDSLEHINQKRLQYQQQFEQIQSDIDAIKDQKEKFQNDIKYLSQNPDSVIKTILLEQASKSKYFSFLQGFQKFEAGRIYPNNLGSANVINGISVDGLNFDYTYKKVFFSFLGGLRNKLILNRFSFDSVSGQLKQFSTNSFKNNFNNWLVSIQSGIGKRESSHAFAGLLLAKDGITSGENLNTKSFRYNVVSTIDLKQYFNENNTLDLQIASSNFLTDQSTIDKAITSSLNLHSKKHAVYMAFTGFISPTHTNIRIKTNYVEPFYRSIASSFNRADFFNWNLQLKQAFGKRLTVNTNIKEEYYNISLNNSLDNKFSNYNLGINYKLNRRWQLVANAYQFKNHSQRDTLAMDLSDSLIAQNKSINTNGATIGLQSSIIYNKPIGRKMMLQTLSIFMLQNGSFNKPYYRSAVTIYGLNLPLNEKFSGIMNLSHFYKVNKDSTINSAFSYLGTQYAHKKIKAEIGIKLNYSLYLEKGFKARISYTHKNTTFSLVGDRLVLNDYINSYSESNLKKFPYLLSFKTQIVF